MPLDFDNLELRCNQTEFGLSARRLWEFTELGQVNPFEKSISQRHELNNPSEFIDVIAFENHHFKLYGLTLAQLKSGDISHFQISNNKLALNELRNSEPVKNFEINVADHIGLCSCRAGIRIQSQEFLPAAQSTDTFGISALHSNLQHKFLDLGKSQFGVEQWLQTINNFRKSGVRLEEIIRSNISPLSLRLIENDNGLIPAKVMSQQCQYDDLKLSVIPVLHAAQNQIRFVGFSGNVLKRVKKPPKPQFGQLRKLDGFDPVLGYRIEQIEHPTLWGKDIHWQAVTHQGNILIGADRRSISNDKKTSISLAAHHASLHFPKRLALGKWKRLAWNGGQDYREWLITLPHHPISYFSSHFNIRNVLAHIRCDLREGVDGEKVLLLHEVQSDWAQNARRAVSSGLIEPSDTRCPPFMKEWPSLCLKLILLHAAHLNLDAVAWTRGAHQVFRFKGLGSTGLKELYDRTLPKEAHRILKPFGGCYEMIGVYVPANFRIHQTENGYEVFTAENELLGISPTLEETRQFVPDGGHELLYEVHGVRLSESIRVNLMRDGFPAWG